MAQSPIAPQIHETLDVHGNFGAQFTLDLNLAVNGFSDVVDFDIRQIVRKGIGINFQLLQNFVRCGPSYSIDVGQSDLNPLAPGQVYTRNTCQSLSSCKMTALTLSLFVPFIFADDPNNALAPYDDALAAYFLYRCPDLHAVCSLVVMLDIWPIRPIFDHGCLF
jgi:hypothetical protein